MLFEGITWHAAQSYGECWRPPQLSLGWLPTVPRPAVASDPYGVAAVTDRANGPPVELQIHPARLGPAAFAVIPYLLVHECVCHVPARYQGKANNASLFNEGLMDWAAKFFLEVWMPGIDPTLAQAALEHATQVDQVLLGPDTPEGAARRRGRRAADVLVMWLRTDRGRGLAEAKAWVAKLAVALNCFDEDLNRKDDFVLSLNRSWSVQLLSRLSAVEGRRRPPESVL